MVGVKGKRYITNSNLVAMFERTPIFQKSVVEIRPVAAVEILDEEFFILHQDLSMMSADRANIDDNLALRVTTKDTRLCF